VKARIKCRIPKRGSVTFRPGDLIKRWKDEQSGCAGWVGSAFLCSCRRTEQWGRSLGGEDSGDSLEGTGGLMTGLESSVERLKFPLWPQYWSDWVGLLKIVGP
jgi:hypothetical protein